ncbi:MAG TPA: aminopeptidase [Gemmatimonadaceae bacterium]|jgi:leucyl aminopeptidase (aminopeptidase T)|nr:aminopeptidase [Gemmatimonadaceae bacterium]
MSSRASIVAALLFGAFGPHNSLMAQNPTDWHAAAAKIVSRLALVRGERVLLVAVPGAADALVPVLREAIRAAGGTDLGAVAQQGAQPPAWSTDFTNELAKRTGEAFDEYLRTVDAAVMMPGATVTDAAYAGMQSVLQSGHGRTVHFHWAGAYDEAGVLLPTTPDIASVYLHALLETDYKALAAKQRAFEAAMRGQVVHVTTPLGTDLRFRIGDRPVTKQDGDASAARAKVARNLIDREVELPAGAVRVAPIESSVEGTIAFPPTAWGGTRVEGLVLTFARGQVTGIRATTGREAVDRELASGGSGARAFRELAVGFNPLLAMPADGRRWIPYYGYGAGVIRLSLGDNTELGGNVGGGYVRWNFFTDATVAVGSDTWVRGGKLVR